MFHYIVKYVIAAFRTIGGGRLAQQTRHFHCPFPALNHSALEYPFTSLKYSFTPRYHFLWCFQSC